MLCEFAHRFPDRVADLLERDRRLTRNFREETITDLLMAGLIGLEGFGIRVDFPHEPTTGGDMDWIYAAPKEINGGRYLRLILQAKRAKYAKLKSGGYWYYQHLDHGNPPGHQAQTLVSYAASSPDGMRTLPLYMFYHPREALVPAAGARPAVEGINIVFADQVSSVVHGGCGRNEKRVGYWRNDFMPLSELLCWPLIINAIDPPPPDDGTQFLLGPDSVFSLSASGGFHPDLVARRLRESRERTPFRRGVENPPQIEAADGLPDDVRRALAGEVSSSDRKRLKRPRVIFSTPLTRKDPEFRRVESPARREGD